MKRLFALFVALCLSLALFSCTDSNSSPESKEVQAKRIDLSGDWKQINSTSETSYQTAVVSSDTIEVFWINSEDDTKSLYWSGTYIEPDEGIESFEWDSVNDKEKTDVALLASGADTKTFNYSDGQITYSVTALGVTQTVKLERVN